MVAAGAGTAAAAQAASWAWEGLLGCAALAVEGLPPRLQPEPAEGVFAVLVLVSVLTDRMCIVC